MRMGCTKMQYYEFCRSRRARPLSRLRTDTRQTGATRMNEAVIDSLRHEANAKLDPKKKGALGQFMTPFKIAEFMAGMFEKRDGAVLLDAGAGIGSLTLAAANAVNVVRAEAWEVDPVMIGYLRVNLASLGVPFELHEKDFILDSVDRIQFDEGTRFTHAILNPPYKKISTESHHRQACRQVGLETVNLYTAFLALAMLQMMEAGEIVIIIPRSFCNGPYYRPFRDLMLSKCSIDAIHVFESRSQTFKDDEVLQENIILKLTRGAKQGAVRLSLSHDASFSDLHSREVPFDVIVHPQDKERFIRIPRDDEDQDGDADLFTHSLKDLGLEVCTGPVVDFRLKQWWSQDPQPGTVPCIYPHHFTKEGFEWPKEHKKPNSLLRSPEVDKWLMREGIYVMVRRFSAKEERRRVVAYLITPNDTKSELVGFENHWNVLHIRKGGLPLDVARGLVVFLNSTALDNYFRVFSGHTQVNATDLRNMKYPSLALLREMGSRFRHGLEQEEVDALLTDQQTQDAE
jgi:adenine-specific DNA-methyltransferase